MSEIKLKLCQNPDCGQEFKQFNSLTKYCSSPCYYKEEGYQEAIKSDRAIPRKYTKNRQIIIEKNKNKFGQLTCESCFTDKGGIFETHHIVYRSRKPKHEHIHHERNLILVCRKCHNFYHEKKGNGQHLIYERNLTELFGNSILNA